MFDVLGVGEPLIDFSPAGVRKNPLFEMNPGGSAANCMAACAALGAKTEFACAVGEDSFGDFIEQSLKNAGIGTSFLRRRKGVHSSLAFVTIDENAVPKYTFIKDKDSRPIKKGEIDPDIVKEAKIVTFSLVVFSCEESYEEMKKVILRAEDLGKTVAFDANYRARQWESPEKAMRYMREGVAFADIIKASETEAEMITGFSDPQKAAKAMGEGTDKFICVTVGEQGIWYYCKGEEGHVPAFKVSAVDTTGCGDSFMGAMLYQTACEPEKTAREKVRFAAAAAAICATGFGGIPSMPSYEKTEELLKK